MQDPPKRVLTNDLHSAHIASDVPPSASDTPDDLLQRLRYAGSRVRKSVTEGYRTTPSSFSRAQSTGSIFRSMNDTMRDVYANPPDPASRVTPARKLKRTRSFSEHEPESVAEISQIKSPLDDADSPFTDDDNTPRKIKPLRAPSRAFLQSRSLPVGAFSFAGSNQSPAITPSTETAGQEEEDWSFENSFQTSQPALEPMLFD